MTPVADSRQEFPITFSSETRWLDSGRMAATRKESRWPATSSRGACGEVRLCNDTPSVHDVDPDGAIPFRNPHDDSLSAVVRTGAGDPLPALRGVRNQRRFPPAHTTGARAVVWRISI
jgi:hypothetical protein